MVIELRYNPLIGEWIMVSSVREHRPWQPSTGCPFDEGNEETGYGWRYLILPNRYPMLRLDAPQVKGDGFYRARRAVGACFVVVETPKHDLGDLCDIGLEDLTEVLKGVRGKVLELEKIGNIKYVYFFRNKGKEIGVSLTHPHSQMYALPYVPLRVRLEIINMRRYRRRRGSCILCDIVKHEESLGIRVIYRNRHFVVLKPYYSMWPYEIHVIPTRHVHKITELSDEELMYLADALRASTAMLNNVLGRDMPYVMAVHQSPVRIVDEYHMHIEFYPMLRDKDKLKYAAGVEWGLWTFTYDYDPEAKASELKEACRRVKDKFSLLGECG